MTTRTVVTIGVLWLAVATVAGAAGAFGGLRPPLPQVMLLSLTAVVLTAIRTFAPFRAWAVGIDARSIVALHITRLFVGAYFLLLQSRGELPQAFATPAGIGDMIVGALAIALVSLVPPSSTSGARGLYFAWNLLGFADILFVVVTATRVGLRDPGSMRALLHLPLSLLPTFLVPLIIASHAFLLTRSPIRDMRSPIRAAES